MLVEAKDICYQTKEKAILKDINFHINKGDIVGLVGHNGAGKTTLLKCISDIYTPTTGAFIKPERIGILIEQPSLYNNKTGYYNLRFFARIYGESQTKVEELINKFQLDKYIKSKVSSYSQGMKQVLAIAIAFLGQPQLVLLDEATNGLDPKVKSQVLQIIKDYAKNNKMTIIISSHDLTSLEKIVDYSIYIKDGENISKNSLKIQYIITVKDSDKNKLIKILQAESYQYELQKNEFYIEEDLKDLVVQKIYENNISLETIKKTGIEEFYNENF